MQAREEHELEIKRKMPEENINSVGGQDGVWRCFSASLCLKFLCRPATRHLRVHSVYQPGSIASVPGTGSGARTVGHPDMDGHL